MNDWLWNALERWGDHIALSDEDGRDLSYRALAAAADDFARALGPERQLVLIEAANTIAAIVALVACLRGCHPVILSSGAAAELVVAGFRPNLIVDAAGKIRRHSDAPHDLHPDLALMLSTSGSTGAAKLVRLSHEALHANAASIADYLGISEQDVPITTLPIGYSYGLSVINSHLLSGARIVLTDRSVVDGGFWDLCTAHGITSLAGVPYTYELLTASGFLDRDLPTLRTLTQAGGRLKAELRALYSDWAAKRGIRFFVMYGQTEATARIAYLPPELQADYGDCIGRAIPGGTLHVEDESGKRLSQGETGELVYEGANVMMGYATRPEELAEGRQIAALRTGDLGQEAAPGIFRIVGRLSRFSKIAGLRIGLDEIEALLARHDVRALVAGDDEVVAVCLDEQALVPAATALIESETAIPPRAVVAFAPDALPRLPSGKPDSPAILKLAKAIKSERDAGAGTSGASGLAALYARALNRSGIAPDQSFASLGGDSLGYIEVSLGIEKLLGYLPDHWETLSIAELESLAAAAPPPAARRSITIETEMLIRPVAMTTIVTGHVMGQMASLHDIAASWTGGALALLMTAGYNACRFQKGTLLSDRRLAVVGNFLRRIVLPFYLIILYKCLQWAHGGPYVAWSTFLLLDDYVRYPDAASFVIYWFIGVMLQCLLILTALFAIPPIRTFARQSGFQFGLVLFAAAYTAKWLVYAALLPAGALMFPNNQLDCWAFAFALGWMVAEARGPRERIACIILGVAAAAIGWGLVNLHTIMLVAAMLLILYFPRLRLPAIANAPIALWARATFFIYITHGFAMAVTRAEKVRALLDHSEPAIVATTVILSTIGGICFYLLWRQVERFPVLVRAALARLRPGAISRGPNAYEIARETRS